MTKPVFLRHHKPARAAAPWRLRLIDLLRGRDPAWRSDVPGRPPEAQRYPSSYGLLVQPH